MIAAPCADDAIVRAGRLPALRVGLHLTLLEGRPVSPTAAVAQLLSPQGTFLSSPAALGMRLCVSRNARRQLATEIRAQFAAFADSGLTLDHCNAHLHFHLHPLVAELIVTIGAAFGLRAVRVPLEPRDVLRNIEPSAWHASGALTLPFALALRRRLVAANLLVAERTFGLRWSGQMTRARLAGIVRHLPEGVSEIYLHPATGPYPGAARGYRYAEELQALTAPEVIAACRDPSLRLGGYGEFAASQSAAGRVARRHAEAPRPGMSA